MQGEVQILSQDKTKPWTACEQEKDMLRPPLLSLSLELGKMSRGAEAGGKTLGLRLCGGGGGEKWMEPSCILRGHITPISVVTLLLPPFLCVRKVETWLL